MTLLVGDLLELEVTHLLRTGSAILLVLMICQLRVIFFKFFDLLPQTGASLLTLLERLLELCKVKTGLAGHPLKRVGRIHWVGFDEVDCDGNPLLQLSQTAHVWACRQAIARQERAPEVLSSLLTL